MRLRLDFVAMEFLRWSLIKSGPSIWWHTGFDMHLNRRRVLTGNRIRMSVIISDGKLRFGIGNLVLVLGLGRLENEIAIY